MVKNFSNILFLVFAIFVMVERMWWTFFCNRKKIQGEIKAKWTSLILIVFHFAVGIGTIAEFFLVKRKIVFPLTLLGIIIFIASFILRYWSIKTLGEYHSIHIEIRKKHSLIKTGPYKFLRHPWYTAIILEVCGFPLIVNAFYTFFFALLVYIPILIIRLKIEEKEMIITFGEDYINYKKETPAFLPFKKKYKNFN